MRVISPAPLTNPQPLHILLVEDNLVNQVVVQQLLKKYGMNVSIAKDGLQAIEAIKQKHYDLIFMDCHMPGMDGYQATRHIRELERQGVIEPSPIIALTAHSSPDNQRACLEAGMNDYLTKPLLDGVLEGIIQHYYPNGFPDKASQNKPAVPPSAETAPEATPRGINAVIFREFAEVVGKRKSIILRKFMQMIENALEDIESAIPKDDLSLIHYHAHSLSSSCYQVGAAYLASQMKLLDQCSKVRNVDGVPRLYHEIKQEYATVKAELSKHLDDA